MALTTTIPVMAASVGLAAAAGLATRSYVQQASKPRLALARADLVSYVAAAGGMLTLLPETVAAFAPELMHGETLAGSVLERLDYVSFVLVSLAFGVGIARRWQTIRLESPG